MAQRVLAIVAAVAFVVVAIAIRSAIDEGGDDDDLPGAGDSEVVVACDVQPACRAMVGGSIGAQAAATTLGRLEDGSVEDLDVWITTTAWVEVLEARAPGLVDEVRPLASSPAVIASLPDRSVAIERACAGERRWSCLGAASGQPWSELGGQAGWGPLTVGLTDPSSAIGLPVLASAAAGYFGSLDFASNDFDDEFRSWLGNLVDDRSGPESAPVRKMVTATGSYSAAGSILAPANDEAGAREITITEPEPAVTATVVAVRFDGAPRFPDLTSLTDALTEQGWGPAPDGEPALTFKPGVMAALHALWTEVSG